MPMLAMPTRWRTGSCANPSKPRKGSIRAHLFPAGLPEDWCAAALLCLVSSRQREPGGKKKRRARREIERTHFEAKEAAG